VLDYFSLRLSTGFPRRSNVRDRRGRRASPSEKRLRMPSTTALTRARRRSRAERPPARGVRPKQTPRSPTHRSPTKHRSRRDGNDHRARV